MTAIIIIIVINAIIILIIINIDIIITATTTLSPSAPSTQKHHSVASTQKDKVLTGSPANELGGSHDRSIHEMANAKTRANAKTNPCCSHRWLVLWKGATDH